MKAPTSFVVAILITLAGISNRALAQSPYYSELPFDWGKHQVFHDQLVSRTGYALDADGSSETLLRAEQTLAKLGFKLKSVEIRITNQISNGFVSSFDFCARAAYAQGDASATERRIFVKGTNSSGITVGPGSMSKDIRIETAVTGSAFSDCL